MRFELACRHRHHHPHFTDLEVEPQMKKLTCPQAETGNHKAGMYPVIGASGPLPAWMARWLAPGSLEWHFTLAHCAVVTHVRS